MMSPKKRCKANVAPVIGEFEACGRALPCFRHGAPDVVPVINIVETRPPDPPHIHRWAWLVDGRQACGYCGVLR